MEKEKKLISSQELFSAIGELLAQGRQAVFTVTGMSMWPFLCHGRDQVVVQAGGNPGWGCGSSPDLSGKLSSSPGYKDKGRLL